MPRRPAEVPGNREFSETEDFPAVGGSEGPAASQVYRFDDYETIWAPAVSDSPGVFSDSAGRRRTRVRLLAVAAAVLLGIIIVVAAIGLLGGPKAPFVPWPTPAAQPQHSSAPGTHRQQRDPATHRAVSASPSVAPQVRARPTTARSPAASSAPAATASASAASSHTPPGMAHRPSAHPTKPQ